MNVILTKNGGLIYGQPEDHACGDDVAHVFDHEPTADELEEVLGAVMLDRARAAAEARLSEACRAAIVAGFECDALGSLHTYPSAETDQINLMGMVLSAQLEGSSWSGDFACADGAGVWARRTHTGAQITAVGLAGAAHKAAALAKLDGLRAAYAAATTVGAVEAVVWG